MCRQVKNQSEMTPRIIFGLGNPGREYAKNRHNVGYHVVDMLARAHGLSFDRRRGKSKLAIGDIDGHKVILVKPRTFMNECGQPVASVLRFFKVPLDSMLVIFDDLDLPIGRIRLRPLGGTGGHRGMSSIIKILGSNEFARLRIGIGRPPGRMDPAAYVLQDFSTQQEEEMLDVRHRAVEAVEQWLTEPVDAVMNVVNSPADSSSEKPSTPDAKDNPTP